MGWSAWEAACRRSSTSRASAVRSSCEYQPARAAGRGLTSPARAAGAAERLCRRACVCCACCLQGRRPHALQGVGMLQSADRHPEAGRRGCLQPARHSASLRGPRLGDCPPTRSGCAHLRTCSSSGPGLAACGASPCGLHATETVPAWRVGGAGGSAELDVHAGELEALLLGVLSGGPWVQTSPDPGVLEGTCAAWQLSRCCWRLRSSDRATLGAPLRKVYARRASTYCRFSAKRAWAVGCPARPASRGAAAPAGTPGHERAREQEVVAVSAWGASANQGRRLQGLDPLRPAQL